MGRDAGMPFVFFLVVRDNFLAERKIAHTQ